MSETICTVNKDGTMMCLRHNEIHCNDGPAIVWANGLKKWIQDGKLHREDGPAIVWTDGTFSWYLYGKEYKTQREYEWALVGLSELITNKG